MTLREQALLGPADRDDDAELGRAGVARGVRRGEDLVEVEERIDVDVGVEPRRLRAERAVFGARARLAVDQALELHLGTAVLEPHPVGEGDDRREIVEGEGRDRQHLVAGERAAFVEQGTLGVEEGIMHARQATRSGFGALGTTGKRPPVRRRPLPPGVAVPATGGRPPAPTACTARAENARAPDRENDHRSDAPCTPSGDAATRVGSP